MINIDAKRGKDGQIYTDPYLYYPKNNNSTLAKQNQDKPYGKFFACDRVNFNNDTQQSNGISERGLEHLTIETNKRYDFKTGDRVKSLVDGRFWEVLTATVDDDGKAKELSLNPPKISVLSLVRTEVNND